MKKLREKYDRMLKKITLTDVLFYLKLNIGRFKIKPCIETTNSCLSMIRQRTLVNLTKQHQWLIRIDIPSNRKIFEDYIKDTVIEDIELNEDSTDPGVIVRRKGSLASISLISRRIPDLGGSSVSDGRLTVISDLDLDMDIQYSEASESEEDSKTLGRNK